MTNPTTNPMSANKEPMKQTSIGKDAAIALAQTDWWKSKSAREAFIFQMNTAELCMPFGEFQRIAEEALDRSVWTHEFAFPESLMAELQGEQSAPSFEDILNLIPAEKRILLTV